MPRVLLLGDSIRMFYEDEVKKNLGCGYEVMSPADENCRFSKYFLNSLRFWLAKYKNPDIIHWNAGLWDTAILYHEDGCFTTISEYVSCMKKILRELKKTKAKIIFATTTPVTDDKKYFQGPMPPAHFNEDIINYNKAVIEAFKDEGIVINDLHSLIYEEKEKYLSEDKIHPNAYGCKILGKAVADKIRIFSDYKNPLYNNRNTNFIGISEKNIQ